MGGIDLWAIYNITVKLEKEVIELVLHNYDSIETVNLRMLIKIMVLKTSDTELRQEMVNIKFGV